MKRGTVTFALIVTLAGCGGGEPPKVAANTTATPTRTMPTLGGAAQACQGDVDWATNPQDSNLVASLEDQGKTLTLNTSASGNGSMDAVLCILRETKASSAVTDHIDATRALDGMQQDEWPGFKARWTYHPDHGLNITFMQTG